MIFDNESAIDSNLVSLAKKLKSHNLDNFSVGLDLKENIWIITMPQDWVNSGLVKITYYKFHKSPYRIWWEVEDEEEREILMEASVKNVSQVINSLLLLRYKNQGVQSDVVAWLAKESLTKSLKEAVKRIAKETPFILTMEEIRILGIEEQRGRITGKKFGL
jgi:hypothetical protein